MENPYGLMVRYPVNGSRLGEGCQRVSAPIPKYFRLR